MEGGHSQPADPDDHAARARLARGGNGRREQRAVGAVDVLAARSRDDRRARQGFLGRGERRGVVNRLRGICTAKCCWSAAGGFRRPQRLPVGREAGGSGSHSRRCRRRRCPPRAPPPPRSSAPRPPRAAAACRPRRGCAAAPPPPARPAVPAPRAAGAAPPASDSARGSSASRPVPKAASVSGSKMEEMTSRRNLEATFPKESREFSEYL